MRDRRLVRGSEQWEESDVRRLLAVMSGVVSIAALLAVAPGAEARTFRVYTCSIFDEQRALGPTIQGGVEMPSG